MISFDVKFKSTKSSSFLQAHRVEQAKRFAQVLSRISAEMFGLFDALITVDDVKIGSKSSMDKI